MQFSFLHLGDIHFARSFSSIASLKENQNEDINKFCSNAIEDAFLYAINYAISNKVDFILIAGDTFDTFKHDFYYTRFFIEQLIKLENEKIYVYIIAGNHDPIESYNNFFNIYNFTNSEYIKFFGLNAEIYDEITFKKDGIELAKIHGLSFEKEECEKNPTYIFRKENNSLFNIGLLHCELDSSNTPYMPCLKSQLEEKNYSYWALGHIHLPSQGENKIQYCGTIQSRNPKETGAHGFRHITVKNNKIVKNDFIESDLVRYQELNIDITNFCDICTLENEIISKLDLNRINCVFLRLILKGENNLNIGIDEIINYLNFKNIFITNIQDLTYETINIDEIEDENIIKILNNYSQKNEYLNQKIEDILNNELNKIVSNWQITKEEIANDVINETKLRIKHLCVKSLKNNIEE